MVPLIVEQIIVKSFAIFYGLLIILIALYHHIRTCFKNLYPPDYSKRPAILDDPKLGEHHTIIIDNKAIHYVAKGNPDDPVIVFLHGFPDFWLTWRDQLIEFGSKGYYAVAIDLPGMGESCKVLEPGSLRVDRVAHEVAQAIKSIVQKSPDHRVILVGHDWGGCVSYFIANQHPDLVSKMVILNAPNPVHFRSFIKRSLRQFIKSWYMLFFNSPFFPDLIFQTWDFFMLKSCFRKSDKSYIFNDQEFEPWKYIFSQPFAVKSALGYYRDFVQNSHFLDTIKLTIKQPTMIIWGESDRALSTEFATEANKFIDNVRVDLIPSSGHFVQHEFPRRVSLLIWDFLRS